MIHKDINNTHHKLIFTTTVLNQIKSKENYSYNVTLKCEINIERLPMEAWNITKDVWHYSASCLANIDG